MCFSLVTLSFEIQPRQAIPVEIKTDTRGFDSNAALSPALCLAGADGCSDGTGRAGGQLSAPRPMVPCLQWVSVWLGSPTGRGSFNLHASHLMKGLRLDSSLTTLKEGKQDPLAWQAGRWGPAEGSGHDQSRELSKIEGHDQLVPIGATPTPKFYFLSCFKWETPTSYFFGASFGIYSL